MALGQGERGIWMKRVEDVHVQLLPEPQER